MLQAVVIKTGYLGLLGHRDYGGMLDLPNGGRGRGLYASLCVERWSRVFFPLSYTGDMQVEMR